MTIQWNKVTWYSKMLALILFVALPFLAFWLGIRYEKLKNISTLYLTSTEEVPLQAASLDNKATSSVIIWKAYRNERVGFEVLYPDSWSVVTIDNNPHNTLFKLPPAPYGSSAKGETFETNISVDVFIDREAKGMYANLGEIERVKNTYYKSEAGENWNWSNLGYQEINGRTFFKDSIVHQIAELRYTTLVNQIPITITLSVNDAMPFENVPSYPDFLTFLQNLKLYPVKD